MTQMPGTPAVETDVRRRYARLERVVILVIALVGLAVAWLAQSVVADRAHHTVFATAREALALQTETLSGVLEKYRLLPPLLSHRNDIINVFADANAPGGMQAAHEMALEIAGYSGAMDVAFAGPFGRVFASARGIFDNSRLNEEALLEAARQGRLGRESLSPQEHERAYVFASAVRRGNALIGVIAIYVRMDQIEQTWALSANPIAVTGLDGSIFISNRPAWQGRQLFGGGDALFAEEGAGEGRTVSLAAGDGPSYLAASRPLPLMGWTLHVLADRSAVVSAQLSAVLITVLAALLAGSLAFFFVKRREATELRQLRADASAQRLENLVRERTADLTEVNAALAHEVKERTEAEEQLRKTQAELIQAAKLAALGQMSATLSHEYNQPLAAIRTYADNAAEFLARGKAAAATDAVARIAGLVDRMSELSRTLLSFARKPGTTVEDVLIAPVIDEALMLAGPRARKAGVAIRQEGVLPGVAVRGGHVRLTQVVVNLVNNAVDALTGIGSKAAVDNPEIVVRLSRRRSRIALSVEDNGPGIPAEVHERMFEPFYSTKGVGEGLGIGLSIVYNIVRDFDGSVSVTERPGGGAIVTVLLAPARQTALRKLAKAS
jgi:two-component system, NtrC family, C4-dicarboxylate transport sensor histidine kinase DctB